MFNYKPDAKTHQKVFFAMNQNIKTAQSNSEIKLIKLSGLTDSALRKSSPRAEGYAPE